MVINVTQELRKFTGQSDVGVALERVERPEQRMHGSIEIGRLPSPPLRRRRRA